MKSIITCGVSDDLRVSRAIVNPFCLESEVWAKTALIDIIKASVENAMIKILNLTLFFLTFLRL